MAVKKLTEKASAARIAPDLVREVEQDAAWNPLAKQEIVEGGAATAAKWLNTSGITAEHADELRLLGGCLAILAGYRTLATKLDAMAKAPQPTAKPDAPA